METTSSLLQTNRTKIIVAIVVISIIAVSFAAYKLYQPKSEVLTEPLPKVLSEPLPKVLSEPLPEVLSESLSKVLSEPLPIEQPKWHQSIPVWAFIGGALIIVGGVSYLLLTKMNSTFDPIKYLYRHGKYFSIGGEKYKYIEGMDCYDVNAFNNLDNSIDDGRTKAFLIFNPFHMKDLTASFELNPHGKSDFIIDNKMKEKFKLSNAKLQLYGMIFYIIDKLNSAFNKGTLARIAKEHESDTVMLKNLEKLKDANKNLCSLEVYNGKDFIKIKDMTSHEDALKALSAIAKIISVL